MKSKLICLLFLLFSTKSWSGAGPIIGLDQNSNITIGGKYISTSIVGLRMGVAGRAYLSSGWHTNFVIGLTPFPIGSYFFIDAELGAGKIAAPDSLGLIAGGNIGLQFPIVPMVMALAIEGQYLYGLNSSRNRFSGGLFFHFAP